LNWYKPILTSHKPPSYVVERISDLLHAAEISITSPGGARSILANVSSQLGVHMDSEYAEEINSVSSLMLDSPVRARELLYVVIDRMLADKEEYLRKDPPWVMNLKKK
jgi:hypothetical protein